MTDTTTATRVTKKALKNAKRALCNALITASETLFVEFALDCANALGVATLNLRDRDGSIAALRAAIVAAEFAPVRARALAVSIEMFGGAQ